MSNAHELRRRRAGYLQVSSKLHCRLVGLRRAGQGQWQELAKLKRERERELAIHHHRVLDRLLLALPQDCIGNNGFNDDLQGGSCCNSAK